MGPTREALALADFLISKYGLTVDRYALAYAIMEHEKYAKPQDDQDRKDAELHELAVLADIRFAIGDNGKRMQGELVAYIAELFKNAERYRWLRTTPNNLNQAVYAACNLLRRDRYLDEAIDAAMAQEAAK